MTGHGCSGSDDDDPTGATGCEGAGGGGGDDGDGGKGDVDPLFGSLVSFIDLSFSIATSDNSLIFFCCSSDVLESINAA